MKNAEVHTDTWKTEREKEGREWGGEGREIGTKVKSLFEQECWLVYVKRLIKLENLPM